VGTGGVRQPRQLVEMILQVFDIRTALAGRANNYGALLRGLDGNEVANRWRSPTA
jgi:hypothetical protein